MSNDTIKHTVDAVAAGITVASLMKWLPAVAALFTIAWTGCRLYESFTGKLFSESWLAKKLTGRA